jgi:hypothetical protein
MTEKFGIPRRATASRLAPKRIYKPRRGPTTFQSCQSLGMGAVSAAIRLSSGECRLKLLITDRSQQSAYLAMDLLGESGTLQHDKLGDDWRRVEHTWTWGAAQRIAGGSDEILKNIVAERVLGLPQDVRVDKDVPFSQLPI